jgi:hypothetical protein
MKFYPRDEAKIYALSIRSYLWQVSFVAGFINARSQVFSAIDHLILECEGHSWLYDSKGDRTEWRQILGSFSHMKTFRVNETLVGDLSRCIQGCLRLDDGEHPLDLLPELQELTYSGNSNTSDVFTSFIDARQNAGRPVTLVRLNPSPDPSASATL